MNKDRIDKVRTELRNLEEIMDKIINLESKLNELQKFKGDINSSSHDTFTIKLTNEYNKKYINFYTYNVEGLRDEIMQITKEKIELQIEKLKNEAKECQIKLVECVKHIV
jgi:hypothetical protein